MPTGGVFYKVLPLMLVVFIWSYSASKVPVLKSVVPAVDGFSPFGVLTFLGIYIAARTSRLYEEKFTTKWLLITAIASGMFCWFGFYHYNSPFALLLAGSVFYLLKQLPCINITSLMGRVVLAISPSMFSVYLLHTNAIGFKLLKDVEGNMIADGWNYYLMSLILAIVIFCGCILLDLPRRLVSWLFGKISCRN